MLYLQEIHQSRNAALAPEVRCLLSSVLFDNISKSSSICCLSLLSIKRFGFFFSKMQKSCKSNAIKLACFAEMQLILCKVSFSIISHPMILYHRVGMGCQGI